MAKENNQLRIRLVTPARILFEHEASAVELPTKAGRIEVFYGHAPLLAQLGEGEVTLHGGPDGPESVNSYNISWGFAEVLPDLVTIVASDDLSAK
jgi:F-type H+-transporting ATPase subunit epsilon